MKAITWSQLREFLNGVRINEKEFPVEVDGWIVEGVIFSKTSDCGPKTANVQLHCPAIRDFEMDIEDLLNQICELEDEVEEWKRKYRRVVRKCGYAKFKNKRKKK